MRRHLHKESLRELVDVDLPPAQLERLARVDALLRTAADRFKTKDRCGATRASISAALDGEASGVELDHIRRHAEDCSSCRGFLAGVERVATTIRRAPAVRPRLQLVSSPPDEGWTQQSEEQRQEVKLSVAELGLIYKSLKAAKTLRVVPPQDELLEDTMQLVDQAIKNA
jgi:hypothetical protein